MREGKRPFLRKGNRGLTPIDSSDPNNIELEQFDNRVKAITGKVSEAIVNNDRGAAKKAFRERDELTEKAKNEIRQKDKQIAKDAFSPISTATVGIDVRLVDAAMNNGTINFKKHYDKVPDSLKNTSSADLEPKKALLVAVELVIDTQHFAREYTTEKAIKDHFDEAQPVTDEVVILEIFNEITPQKRIELERDMAKLYTYIALNSPDRDIDDKLIGPALARAYVDYRATLKALQLQQS